MLSTQKRANPTPHIYAAKNCAMSDSGALSPIPDDSHSSESADTEVNPAASSAGFWPTAVAAHANAALELLAELNTPDSGIATDAAHAVDRIRTNADAACADDLRNTQQHVHKAYAHAEHSQELSVRLASLDAAAAWRLAQYVYESQAAVAAQVQELEQRLAVLQSNAREHEVATAFEFRFLHGATEGARQHTEDRVHSLHVELQEQLEQHIERVARSSVANHELNKKHEGQIQDLNLALTDLQDKYEALNTRTKPPARKWSLFSSADANAFASVTP
jgi:hypothetical protein